MADAIVLHYSEVALKGQNRPFFERQLTRHLRRALAGQRYRGIRRLRGRIVIDLPPDAPLDGFSPALAAVFGVASYAFAHSAPPSLDAITQAVLAHVPRPLGPDWTIRVHTTRADKRFPYSSMEVDRHVGQALVDQYHVGVDLTAPRRVIHIEITEREAFIYFERHRGPGGLPVGSNGRVLALLSGGIDSPVAAWLLMKRGCAVEYLHFHPFPQFDPTHVTKITALAQQLAPHGGPTRIHFAPFDLFQVEALRLPPRYALLSFRRFMLRVAEGLAQREGITALATGENLGQVSSQTVENLGTIEAVTRLPVLRPLLTYDKADIIRLAQQLGTYSLSLQPYKDCCQVFMDPHPATRAPPDRLDDVEQAVDMPRAVAATLAQVRTVEIHPPSEAASTLQPTAAVPA